MENNAALALGEIVISTRINKRGYNRDKRFLTADASRLGGDMGAALGGALTLSMGSQISGRIRAQIEDEAREALRTVAGLDFSGPRLKGRQERPEVFAASFGRQRQFVDQGENQGVQAGQAMGEGVARGFSQSEGVIRAQFDKSITKAILVSDAIKFGLKKAVDASMGSLPGQITQVIGSTLQGGGLSEAINIELETNTSVSTIAALTNLDLSGAADQVQQLNEQLAKSAATLPGNTQDYKRLANVLSDNVLAAFKDVNGELDSANYTDSLSSITESYGALTASSTRDVGNTSLALTRALGGASTAELRNFAFFEQNPTALNQINEQVSKAGVQSLRDLTIEGRVQLLDFVGKSLITDDYKSLAEDSVDGLLQSFRSRLFDPSTGIFGINRDLDKALDGTQSVFTSFRGVLKALISENAEDQGLLFRMVESAQRAGLQIGEPLANQKRILDALADTINNLKGQTDQLFQSRTGQAFIATFNMMQSAVSGLLSDFDNIKLALAGVATVAAGPLGGAIALIATNSDRLLPVASGIGGELINMFEAAVPLAQQFSEILVSILEKISPVLQSTLGAASTFLSESSGAVSGALGGAFGGESGGFGGESGALGAFGGGGFGGESGALGAFGGESGGEGEQLTALQGIAENVNIVLREVFETLGNIGNLIIGFTPSIAPILDAVTDLGAGVLGGISEGVERISVGLRENSGAIASAFGTIGQITQALKPGLIAIGGLVGEVVSQTIDFGAELLNNKTVIKILTGAAQLLSKTLEGALGVLEDNKWILKVAAIAVGIGGIVKAVMAISAGWSSVAGTAEKAAPTILKIKGFAKSALTIVGSIKSGVLGVLAAMNPVTLTVAAIAVGVGGLLALAWKFREPIGAALNLLKNKVTGALKGVWDKLEGVRNRAQKTKEELGQAAKRIDKMLGLSKKLEKPFGRLKDFAGSIKSGLQSALSYLMKMDGPLKQLSKLMGRAGKAVGGMMGRAGKAIKSGLFTAPESSNGGSAAYHIDTKLSKDLSMEERVGLMDQLAEGYKEMGKQIEFSNAAVAGEVWDVTASFKEKSKLLQRAAAAHSHSMHAAFDSIDYYIPDIGKNRFDASAENAEMLLPNVAGGSVEFDSGGRYGNYAVILDKDGNIVLKQGHGDDSRAIPDNFKMGEVAMSGSGGGGGFSGDIFSGGTQSFVARAIGLSEGTRTESGGFTDAYSGHTDPGNGAFNQGSFSAQQGFSSGEAADKYWLNKLENEYLPQFMAKAEAVGLAQNREVMLSFLDLVIQAPAAAVNRGGFLDQLGSIAQQGATQNSIVDARVQSYINPATGQFDAPGLGNNEAQIRRDQNRRQSALVSAININGGSSPSLPDIRYDEIYDEVENDFSEVIETATQEGLESGVDEAAPDLSQFIDPSQQAQRALDVARDELRREGELNQQARKEEDTRIRQEREQRQAELQAEISGLDPRDSTGKAILEYQQQVLGIEEQIGDRLRQAERQLEDLGNARELKVRQLEAVTLKRQAFEDQLARGLETGGVTEEALRKEEAAISAIDYTAAIAEHERYRDSIQDLVDPQLEAAKNGLNRQIDAETKKTRELVRATISLNNQYGDVSPFAKLQEQLASVGVAYEKRQKELENQLASMKQWADQADLNKQRQIDIVTGWREAEQSLNTLTAARERALEVLERTYALQVKGQQLGTVQSVFQSQSRTSEATARSVERFAPDEAKAIRRRNAEMQLLLQAEGERQELIQEQRKEVERLQQAIAENDEVFLRSREEIGRGSVEDIQSAFEQNAINTAEFYRLQFESIKQQFPTVAEEFKLAMSTGTNDGIKQGILGIVSGKAGLFESIGNLFNGLWQRVLEGGATRLADMATGALFGNGDESGFLDGLFGSNESSLLSSSEQSSSLLEQGGMMAGQAIAEGAAQAARMLAGGQATVAAPLSGKVSDSTGINGGSLGSLFGGSKKDGRPLFAPLTGALDKAPQKQGPLEITAPFNPEVAGEALGESFTETMPESGKVLGQGLGGILQNLFSGGGGGGGGGIFNILGSVFSLFNEGGKLRTFSGGGLLEAVAKEKSAPMAGNPMIGLLGKEPIVMNDKEYLLPANATAKLEKDYGPRFLEGLRQGYVRTMAEGGAIDAAIPRPSSMILEGSRSPGTVSAAETAINIARPVQTIDVAWRQVGNEEMISRPDFERAIAKMNGEIKNRPTLEESIQGTTEVLARDLSARSRLGLG